MGYPSCNRSGSIENGSWLPFFVILLFILLAFNGGKQMDRPEIDVKVTSILTERLGVSEARVKVGSHLIDDLGADSLDAVEVIMALEDTFDIDIPDVEADTLKTVGAICEYIEKRLGSK